MAEEVNKEEQPVKQEPARRVVNEEEGGVVTTIKKNVTSDLDVAQLLADRKGDEPAGEEEPKKEEPKPEEKKEEEKKPAKKETPKGGAEESQVDDDGDEKVDFNALSPKQQKAVAKLYKERRAAKREMRELREQVSDLASRVKTAGRDGAPAAEPERRQPQFQKPVRPKIEDFAGREGEYDAAMEKYEDDKYQYRRAIERQEQAQREQVERDARTIEDFNKKAREFAKTHPDYEEVVDSDTPMSPLMFGAVLEHGPALGYYFATNPERSEEISEMDDKAADRAIMRIVIKLEDEAEAAVKGAGKKKEEEPDPAVDTNKNKKPEPPNPLAGRGAAAPERSSAKAKSFKDREKEFAKNHPGLVKYET